jgi:hypothetical protein
LGNSPNPNTIVLLKPNQEIFIHREDRTISPQALTNKVCAAIQANVQQPKWTEPTYKTFNGSDWIFFRCTGNSPEKGNVQVLLKVEPTKFTTVTVAQQSNLPLQPLPNNLNLPNTFTLSSGAKITGELLAFTNNSVIIRTQYGDATFQPNSFTPESLAELQTTKIYQPPTLAPENNIPEVTQEPTLTNAQLGLTEAQLEAARLAAKATPTPNPQPSPSAPSITINNTSPQPEDTSDGDWVNGVWTYPVDGYIRNYPRVNTPVNRNIRPRR